MASPRTGSVAQRLEGIDALRGLVILIMVVDHARDYAHGPRVSDPMDLSATPPLLFWMRWAAHFCAPVFTFLAGVSAAIQLTRGDSRAAARHLVARGLVLVLLEFTIVHFAWTFSLVWPMYYAQVIWGLGLSMIAVGLLQPAAPVVRLALGVLIVAGHNLLDGWHPTAPPALHWAWAILHDRQVMALWEGVTVRTSYPVLPMIGLALLGEAAGRWYVQRSSGTDRRLTVATTGALLLLVFLILRGTNVYGDPHAALYTGDIGHDLFALLNTTKYPMSLSFMLMTVGPALLVLAAWDGGVPRAFRWLMLPGQVPMFLYIAHLYLLHLLGWIWALADGYRWRDFDFRATIGGMPKDFAFDLWLTLPFAAVTIVLLWPAARWYAALRASRRYRVTRYV